jgi:hypothetical protein
MPGLRATVVRTVEGRWTAAVVDEKPTIPMIIARHLMLRSSCSSSLSVPIQRIVSQNGLQAPEFSQTFPIDFQYPPFPKLASRETMDDVCHVNLHETYRNVVMNEENSFRSSRAVFVAVTPALAQETQMCDVVPGGTLCIRNSINQRWTSPCWAGK